MRVEPGEGIVLHPHVELVATRPSTCTSWRIDHVRDDDGADLVMLRDPWGLPIQLALRAAPML